MTSVKGQFQEAIRAIQQLPHAPQRHAQLQLFQHGVARIQWLEAELARKHTLRDEYMTAALQGLMASDWAAGRPLESIVGAARQVVNLAIAQRDVQDPPELPL